MSQHFMTVCVVCVLCAAHIPCSAHTTISELKPPLVTNEKDFLSNTLANEQLKSIDKIYDDKINNINYENKRKTTKKKAHNERLKQFKNDDYEIHHDNDYNIRENEEIMERLGQVPSQMNDNNLLINRKYSNSYKSEKRRAKRHAETEEKYFLKKIFDTYGDGNSLTMDGFEMMLERLGLVKLIMKIGMDKINLTHNEMLTESSKSKNITSPPNNINNNDNKNNINNKQKCVSKNQLLTNISPDINLSTSTKNHTILPGWLFERLCPVLLYHLSSTSNSEREGCISLPDHYHDIKSHDEYFEEESTRNMVQVWVYSTISIVVISLCGLLGVAVIPVMGKSYYHQLIQFLVALAIGTLCGDALIHLLPHAMMAPHSHDVNIVHSEIDSEESHNLNMWKGLVAMMGLILFFFMEKALSMISEWRKYRQRKNKLPTRVRVMRETEGVKTNPVGEKLCKHKYSSYPYCYGEITTETRDNHHEHHHDHNDKERLPSIEEAKPLTSNSNNQLPKIITDDLDKNNHENWSVDDHKLNNSNKNISKDNLDNPQIDERESYTVIIREHENKHHGHTHSHGHVHAAPESMSSVAWMVIMGDGLHNFTDGMAIGAAFSANIAGGFSTAIAVFCHELPHELGDFAVLLKAGMSAKQAVFYNLLSSVLCLFGMIFGVLLGALPSTTSWIFAAAAGMFIYIALVDMIPELSSVHSEEGGSHWQCMLQALGLITGLGIMLIIALYEHDLKHIFSE